MQFDVFFAVRMANNYLILEGDVDKNADNVLFTFMDLKSKILICSHMT